MRPGRVHGPGMIDRLAYGAVAGLAVAVAAFAVQAGLDEAKLARFSTATEVESFRAFSSSRPERALSLRGDRALLYACDDVMSGRVAGLVPLEVLKDSIENCADLAGEISAAAPTWALPPYILAVAAHYREDSTQATAKLRLSQGLGPFQSWLAERRIGLALELAEYSQEPREVEDIISFDLSRLMKSTLGRAFCARIYVSDPKRRDEISALADELSIRERSEFLDRVRDEMQRVRNARI